MIINYQKQLNGMIDDYSDWCFECPECECGTILPNYKYCPVCGKKLEWQGVNPDLVEDYEFYIEYDPSKCPITKEQYEQALKDMK